MEQIKGKEKTFRLTKTSFSTQEDVRISSLRANHIREEGCLIGV